MATSPLRLSYSAPISSLPTQQEMDAQELDRARNERATGWGPLNPILQGYQSFAAGDRAGDFNQQALDAEVEFGKDSPAFSSLRRKADMEAQKSAIQRNRVGSIADVNGVGDALNYLGGGLGQVAGSMASTIAGAAAGALVGGPGGALVGGLRGALIRGAAPLIGGTIAGYDMNRGETVSGQYADPQAMERSAQERSDTASMTALGKSALDAIPAAYGLKGLAGAGKVARAERLMSRPMQVLTGAAGESGTEMLQTEADYQGLQALGSTKERNLAEYADAGILGAMGGGAFTGATNLVGAAMDKGADATQAVKDNKYVQEGTELATKGAKAAYEVGKTALGLSFDAATGAVKGVDRAAQHLGVKDWTAKGIKDSTTRLVEQLKNSPLVEPVIDAANKAVDATQGILGPEYFDNAATSLGAAMQAKSWSELVRNSFGNPIGEFLSRAGLTDIQDPAVIDGSKTPEAAAAERDGILESGRRQAARTIIDSPAFSTAEKQRVANMGTDYSKLGVEDTVWLANRVASRYFAPKLDELYNAGRDLLQQLADHVFGALNKTDAAADPTKRNSQVGTRSDFSERVTSIRARPLTAALGALSSDRATNAPAHARQLLQINDALQQAGDLTLEQRSFMTNLSTRLMEYDKKDTVLKALQEAEAYDLLNVLTQERAAPGALADLRGESSLLRSMIPDADSLPRSVLEGIAGFVDEYAIKYISPGLNEHQRDAILAKAIRAFGSEMAADRALTEFGQQRKEGLEAAWEAQAAQADAAATQGAANYRAANPAQVAEAERVLAMNGYEGARLQEAIDRNLKKKFGAQLDEVTADDIADAMVAAAADVEAEYEGATGEFDASSTYGAEYGALTEQGPSGLEASFKLRNPNRPFRNDDRALSNEAMAKRTAADPSARVMPLLDYLEGAGIDPALYVRKMAKDFQSLLRNSEGHRAAYEQFKKETGYTEEADDQKEALSVDVGTPIPEEEGGGTRVTSPFRQKLEALQLAVKRAEANLRSPGGAGEHRRALDALEAHMDSEPNPYRGLKNYSVIASERNDTVASDALLEKFKNTIANKTRASDDEIQAVKIHFKVVGGMTKMTLAADSMMAASPEKGGSMLTRFLGALGAVLNRPDVVGLDMTDKQLNDMVVSRKLGITFGELVKREQKRFSKAGDVKKLREQLAKRAKATEEQKAAHKAKYAAGVSTAEAEWRKSRGDVESVARQARTIWQRFVNSAREKLVDPIQLLRDDIARRKEGPLTSALRDILAGMEAIRLKGTPAEEFLDSMQRIKDGLAALDGSEAIGKLREEIAGAAKDSKKLVRLNEQLKTLTENNGELAKLSTLASRTRVLKSKAKKAGNPVEDFNTDLALIDNRVRNIVNAMYPTTKRDTSTDLDEDNEVRGLQATESQNAIVNAYLNSAVLEERADIYDALRMFTDADRARAAAAAFESDVAKFEDEERRFVDETTGEYLDARITNESKDVEPAGRLNDKGEFVKGTPTSVTQDRPSRRVLARMALNAAQATVAKLTKLKTIEPAQITQLRIARADVAGLTDFLNREEAWEKRKPETIEGGAVHPMEGVNARLDAAQGAWAQLNNEIKLMEQFDQVKAERKTALDAYKAVYNDKTASQEALDEAKEAFEALDAEFKTLKEPDAQELEALKAQRKSAAREWRMLDRVVFNDPVKKAKKAPSDKTEAEEVADAIKRLQNRIDTGRAGTPYVYKPRMDELLTRAEQLATPVVEGEAAPKKEAAPTVPRAIAETILRAPEFAHKKETAKALGAKQIMAPQGVRDAWSSTLAATAKRLGMLLGKGKNAASGAIIYASVPGGIRGWSKDALTAFIEELKDAMDAGAYIRLDTAKMAFSKHNIEGEGVVHKALHDAGYAFKEVKGLYGVWSYPDTQQETQTEASGNSFEIVKQDFGKKIDGVIDGHRAGSLNVTNARPGGPGALGNPFVAVDAGGKLSRKDAVAKFKEAFLKRVNSDPAYKAWALSLRGKKIGYYKPDEQDIHLHEVQKWLAKQPAAQGSAPTDASTKPMNVYYGSGENKSLSNFALRPFEWKDDKYYSVEHAYQTLKSGTFDDATYGKYTGKDGQHAKGTLGTKTDDNWNLRIIKSLMRASFKQNPKALEALLATGDRQITHKAPNLSLGVWEEAFPRILMELREELGGAGDVTRKNRQAVDINRTLHGDDPTKIAVTHDSPHKVGGKFEWEQHRGKGEGSAAFSEGHYVSTSDATSRHYKWLFSKEERYEDKLDRAKESLAFGMDQLRLMDEVSKTAPFVLGDKAFDTEDAAYAWRDANGVNRAISDRAELEARVARDRAFLAGNFEQGKSPTYALTLDAQPDELLHWHKPLSEQNPGVVERLKKDSLVESLIEELEWKQAKPPTGEAVYNALKRHFRGDGVKASQYLRDELGFVAMEHYAQGGSQQDFPNYAVWNTDRLTQNYVEFNKQNAKSTLNTPAQIQAARDEVLRSLGPKVLTMVDQLIKDLGGSGEFRTRSGKEIIELALDAANIQGVARHEIMHAFFKRLAGVTGGEKIRQDMLDVASSPRILNALTKLLSKDPNDAAALQQIQEGQPDYLEERVAYMYQFWADGLLDVTPKARGMFQKIQDFFRHLVGMLKKEAQVEKTLAKLRAGEFAMTDVAASGDAKRSSYVGTKFGGKGVKTAAKMIKAGETPLDVFKQTGWFRGPDGKLRKELDPTPIINRVKEIVAAGTKTTTVKDVLESTYPEMLRKYGEKFGEITIDLAARPNPNKPGGAGSWHASTNSILVRPKIAYMGLFWLQQGTPPTLEQKEQFFREMGILPVPDLSTPAKAKEEFGKVLASKRIEVIHAAVGKVFPEVANTPLDSLLQEAVSNVFIHELQHAIQTAEGFATGGDTDVGLISKYSTAENQKAAAEEFQRKTYYGPAWVTALEQAKTEVLKNGGDVVTAAREAYLSITGEQEAKDVQNRLAMTKKDRAEALPVLMDPERDFLMNVLREMVVPDITADQIQKPTTPAERKAAADAAKVSTRQEKESAFLAAWEALQKAREFKGDRRAAQPAAQAAYRSVIAAQATLAEEPVTPADADALPTLLAMQKTADRHKMEPLTKTLLEEFPAVYARIAEALPQSKPAETHGYYYNPGDPYLKSLPFGNIWYGTDRAPVDAAVAELKKVAERTYVDTRTEELIAAGHDPKVSAKISDLEAAVARTRASMENRPETGPDAEAAVGQKLRFIDRTNAEIAELKKQAKAAAPAPAPAPDYFRQQALARAAKGYADAKALYDAFIRSSEPRDQHRVEAEVQHEATMQVIFFDPKFVAPLVDAVRRTDSENRWLKELDAIGGLATDNHFRLSELAVKLMYAAAPTKLERAHIVFGAAKPAPAPAAAPTPAPTPAPAPKAAPAAPQAAPAAPQAPAPKARKRPKRANPTAVHPVAAEIQKIVYTSLGKGPRLKLDQTVAQMGKQGYFSGQAGELIAIAIDTADPLGNTHHEVMHAFFARLGFDKKSRELKNTLTSAVSLPHVLATLEDFVKGMPDALAAIKQGAPHYLEERLALAYQIYTTGGPAALGLTPAVRNIFGKIAAYFRSVLNLLNEAEVTEKVMLMLHSGELASPNTIHEKLATLRIETSQQTFDRYVPYVGDAVRSVFKAGTDVLRDSGVQALVDVADKFEGINGELGFIDRRARVENIFTSRLAKLLDKHTEEEIREATESAQAMRPLKPGLETEVAKLLNDVFAYMDKKGVKTSRWVEGTDGDPGYVEWIPIQKINKGRYFPRQWDGEYITTHEKEWNELLTKNGVSLSDAAKLTEAIVKGDGRLELKEGEHHLGFTPYVKALQHRGLQFINEKNAAAFAKFQSKDTVDILTTYIRQAAHRGEYAEMFGNNGEVIEAAIAASKLSVDEKVKMRRTISGLEGTLGWDMPQSTKELFSAGLTIQNVLLLPLAIYSQMIDPLMIAARSGDVMDAGRAYLEALKQLKNKITGERTEAQDLADMMGMLSEESVIAAMGNTHGSMYMSGGFRKFNEMFFRYNGLQGWNQSMRSAATLAGVRYLIKNKDNATELADIGLKPSDVVVGPNNSLVVKGNKKVQEALFRFVDESVVRPNALHRPTWMSDPRFMLIAHLKQFTFSQHKVILSRVADQAEKGNYQPAAMLALAAPVMLAADMAKWMMTGTVPDSWTWGDYASHAVQRAGILGKGQFAADALNDAARGGTPGTSFLGPTFEHLATLFQGLTGSASGQEVLERSIPAGRYIL